MASERQSHGIVWFRSDLRCRDNPALFEAASRHAHLTAVFILTPEQWNLHGISPTRRHFLRRCLDALSKRLATAGIALKIVRAERFSDCPRILSELSKALSAEAIYANEEYLLDEQQRDAAVQSAVDVPLNLYHGKLIIPPPKVLTAADKPYSVFTPFARNWRRQLQQSPVACLKAPQNRHSISIAAETCPVFGEEHDSEGWLADEDGALEQMRDFSREKVEHYSQTRDFPAIEGTSRCSAALAVGLLSPRQCLARLQIEFGDEIFEPSNSCSTWLTELIWREFYYHVAAHYPRVVKGKAFQEHTDRIPWRSDPADFKRWCEGRTGFPIVDAAQRQLLETGWMHNRLRMISASFLVKDLQLDWRLGERWFMQHLIDGDFPANNGGWQWAASTGTDAAPYFRVFNPTTQGKRFDKEGLFIRRFVPELANFSGKDIHNPGADYLTPMVDHKAARIQAIELFKALK